MKYRTSLDEVIEYRKPSAQVAEFLDRVTKAAEDPSVSENALISLVYGAENPILESGLIEGRGAVTKEVFANPIYHVLQDLLQRKRIAAGQVTVEALEQSLNLTVAEAAEQLEVTPAAVRSAIKAGHLTAVKRPNGYVVDSRSVASYRNRVTRRGPPKGAQLRARTGNAPGHSLRLKVLEGRTVRKWKEGDGRFTDLEVDSFKRAAVVYSEGDENKCLIIEPAVRVERFESGPFSLEGQFKVVERVTSPRQASEAFRAFEAN